MPAALEVAARAYSARSRVEQGLPARLRDPAVIARLTVMITSGSG